MAHYVVALELRDEAPLYSSLPLIQAPLFNGLTGESAREVASLLQASPSVTALYHRRHVFCFSACTVQYILGTRVLTDTNRYKQIDRAA
jgi:hypothetical protein